jgi:tripartite-type tricarboxylate transporter receptor subunit TctC
MTDLIYNHITARIPGGADHLLINLYGMLYKEINSAIATPEIQKRFKDLIMEPRTGTPEELQKMYDSDVTMWRRIITEAKIQPN